MVIIQNGVENYFKEYNNDNMNANIDNKEKNINDKIKNENIEVKEKNRIMNIKQNINIKPFKKVELIQYK